MSSPTLRIATRGSRLALWQAEFVRDSLTAAHPALTIEFEIVVSSGDANRVDPLHKLGGIGLFTKEIQDAVLDGRAHVAVHSLKDLPTEPHPKLKLAAVPKRGLTEDALLSPRFDTLMNLPQGAKVATSSLRRRAQLLRHRPDLTISDLRGNVETRIRKLDEWELDAIVLAAAGLDRLGLADRITERFTPDVMLPAVGQGALGIECRADDEETANLLQVLNDGPTHAAVLAERAYLFALQGGCQLPIGALATVDGDDLRLRGNVVSRDGSKMLEGEEAGRISDAVAIGRSLGERLLSQGARGLLQ